MATTDRTGAGSAGFGSAAFGWAWLGSTRLRRLARSVVGVSLVVSGLALVLVAFTLGRCDAFGGRCGDDAPTLLADDTFGMAVTGGALVVAGVSLVVVRTRRGVAAATVVGVVLALVLGFVARSGGS